MFVYTVDILYYEHNQTNDHKRTSLLQYIDFDVPSEASLQLSRYPIPNMFYRLD